MKNSDLKMLANNISRLPFRERRLHVFRLLKDLNKYYEKEIERKIKNYVV